MSVRIPEMTLKKVEPVMPRLVYEYRQPAPPETLLKTEKEISATYLMTIEAAGRAWSLGLVPAEQSGMANLSRGSGWMTEGTSPEPEKVGLESNEVRNKRLFGIG